MRSNRNSVLIIDDDETDNYINTKLFNIVGIRNVTCISNALDSIFYIHNVDNVPNYVFIDFNMHTIDGFDIVRRFKKLNRSYVHTQFYFLSNSLDPSDRIRASKLDIGIIEKPLTFNIIKKILLK